MSTATTSPPRLSTWHTVVGLLVALGSACYLILGEAREASPPAAVAMSTATPGDCP
jgi:hypothetical protein